MDVLDRVRKLLNLSKSSNVNEAAVAAAKAQELIVTHKLSVAALQAEQHTPNEPIIESNNIDAAVIKQKISIWQKLLLDKLCEVNTCKVWFSTFRKNGLITKKTINLIGTQTNVDIVKYMFAYLILEIERLAQHEMKFGRGKGQGKTWGNNFRIGAVTAVGEKLTESVQTAKKAYSGSQALVIVNRQQNEVDEYYSFFSKKMNLRTGPGYSITCNEEARAAGYKAGKNINLSKGIAANSKSNLLDK